MDSILDRFLAKLSKILNIIGGTALTLMMFLTVSDVFMRAFGRPILGTYEVVSLMLCFVIGFGIPAVSMERGHVYMDFIVERLPVTGKAVANTITRLICIVLFAIIGYNLFGLGNEFYTSGEVSATIKVPFFPLVYGLGICCFVECFVFIVDIMKIWGGHYE